jgi:hypothetical protein
MRTTLTLDDDVASLLQRIQARDKRRTKQIVNQALRDGLTKMLSPKRGKAVRFRTNPVSLGACLVSSLDDVADALAAAEGENYR